MSGRTETLVISFQAAPGDVGAAESWWLRIVPEQAEPDTASVSEVAGLIDDIYGLEPCNPNLDQQGGKGQEVDPETGRDKPPVEEDEFRAKVAQHMDFLACQVNDRGDYETRARIYRSHPAEPYKLIVLGGGDVVRTVKVQEQVTVSATLDNQDSLDLEMPVLSGFSAAWQGRVYIRAGAGSGHGVEITRRGSTLSFSQVVTGRLRASFLTEYDLVTVRIDGHQGAPRPGRLVAFYHGLAWEGDVEPPDVPDDDQANLACGPGSGTITVRCSERTCLKRTRHYSRCACTGETVGEYSEEPVEVPCPDDWCFGHGDAHLDEVVFDGYTNGHGCPDHTGQVSDPEFYEQTCCHPPDVPLPNCETVYRKAAGGKEIEGGIEAARRKYGPNARFVAVTPSDGNCGTITVRQSIVPRNCCDDVPPIAWDYDQSADVVADNSSCLVFVTGGRPPYTWSVRGSGFYVDPARTQRDVVTDSPVIMIYTANACGSCAVYVTDGCSSVSEYLRSTVGRWVSIGNVCEEEWRSKTADINFGPSEYSGYDYIGFYIGNNKRVIQSVGIADANKGFTCDHVYPDCALSSIGECQYNYIDCTTWSWHGCFHVPRELLSGTDAYYIENDCGYIELDGESNGQCGYFSKDKIYSDILLQEWSC